MHKPYFHPEDRETVVWTSLGRYGRGPVKRTLIKDLSDSHLMRIIEWIKTYPTIYDPNLLRLLEQEVTYRTENHIFNEETYGQDDPKDGPSLY